jgi:tetraacyldisaccharide 4'-kinase
MIRTNLLQLVRYLLFPFAIVYYGVVSLRNFLYDNNVLNSTSFDFPVIVVGNLSVGGTGKTPQIEYLIRHLQSKYTIAVLSRGYKRRSKGFVKGVASSTVYDLGDEPFQYFSKYPNSNVAVDADRVSGITKLTKVVPNLSLVLLDDAFQHRKLRPSFSILLTSYDALFINDYVFPVGNLREPRIGYKRADLIVVTKCPTTLTIEQKKRLQRKLKVTDNLPVLFSSIKYMSTISGGDTEITISKLVDYELVLVTGIAKPTPLLQFLEDKKIRFTHLDYPDHYDFQPKDVEKIQNVFEALPQSNKLILTTEKDFTRLSGRLESLYYLGIEASFSQKDALIIEGAIDTHLEGF